MSEWLLRWQCAPQRWQWAILLASPLLLLSLLAWWQLWPLQQQSQRMMNQHQQLLLHYQARMAQLRAQPALETRQQQYQQLLDSLQPAAERAFSLVTLVARGGTIEKWQPEPQGGELTLLLSWPQFQQTLEYLATRQPPVMMQNFYLHRRHDQLRFTLRLDVTDEN